MCSHYVVTSEVDSLVVKSSQLLKKGANYYINKPDFADIQNSYYIQ